MALVVRKLRATVSLAAIAGQAQTFANSGGSDSVIIENLRMGAEILHAGGPSDGTLDLTVYGLSKSTINRLSTLGMQINLVPKNLITLEAGQDDGSGGFQGGTAFTGYILAAYADFNAQPDVSFHISAHTLTAYSSLPAKATSYRGSTPVATIMSSFASLMGLRFENSGVTTQLQNPYFSGSTRKQAQDCAKAAGIAWNHGEGGTLAIWPKNGSRNGQIPLIAPLPQGSMKGYPTYTAYGISVENLYDPSIGFGQQVQVQSSLQPACGNWTVYGLSHNLSCEMPDGPWFSTILCYNPKLPNAAAPIAP
jgi:hypothetical protein